MRRRGPFSLPRSSLHTNNEGVGSNKLTKRRDKDPRINQLAKVALHAYLIGLFLRKIVWNIVATYYISERIARITHRLLCFAVKKVLVNSFHLST